jgi:hypothetical protein
MPEWQCIRRVLAITQLSLAQLWSTAPAEGSRLFLPWRTSMWPVAFQIRTPAWSGIIRGTSSAGDAMQPGRRLPRRGPADLAQIDLD